jgi:alpha-N-acetylglucosamine transferase
LTAVANNNYVTPTLALAHTLDQFSCVKTKVALVPEDLELVSETTRDLLRKAGFEVRVKPSLDCMSAHGSGASEIALYPGTNRAGPKLLILFVSDTWSLFTFAGEYMRLYGWNMTEFDKIVYVDCDIMLLDNIDELFETPLQVPFTRPLQLLRSSFFVLC